MSKLPSCLGVWSSITGEKRLWWGSSSFGVVRPEAKGELVVVVPLYDGSWVKDGYFSRLSRLVREIGYTLTRRDIMDMKNGVPAGRCSDRREGFGWGKPRMFLRSGIPRRSRSLAGSTSHDLGPETFPGLNAGLTTTLMRKDRNRSRPHNGTYSSTQCQAPLVLFSQPETTES